MERKFTLGKYIFFQHCSQSTPPASVCIHLISSMVLSHLMHAFFFFRFDSSNGADVGFVSDRIGSLGCLFSGDKGGTPGTVFERILFPLKFDGLDPVAGDPSSKSVSIALSRWV